jgi:hypothetical protein
VEDKLYRIPRYHLERDPDNIFAAMFSLPQSQNEDGEGMSDANPIKLEGVSKVDWEHFLEALYPL